MSDVLMCSRIAKKQQVLIHVRDYIFKGLEFFI
jgi:hypothetical protein